MVETTTQLLHRLTSYEPGREWTDPAPDERIVQDLVVNDADRFPKFYKQYPADLPRMSLPRELLPARTAATAVLAGAEVDPTDLDLAGLARLLYLSAGVTRTTERNGRRWLFRAAGSAGARFPLELYAAVPDGGALPAGVHWYDPLAHELVQVAAAPLGDAPSVVVTGVPWRTGWRYRERGYRHIYWDAGTMLAQLLAVADSAGVAARLFAAFPDAAVADLVGADGAQEFPVAVVGLGSGEPALKPRASAVAGEFDPDAVVFPLVVAAQRAGHQDRLGPETPRGARVRPAADEQGEPLDEVVLRRGSTRRLDPTGALARDVVVDMLAAAMRGIDVPHWLVVHSVDGVAPGLYRWPDLDTAVRAVDLREEAFRVALEQGLARDAAFVAVSAIDLAGLDDHGYREAHLAAGIVEGRLHLLAYALGAGASGMTFQDADIPAFLGADVACLLWTCVGVPEYPSKAGGAPGTPTSVRMVNPR
ncbi:nitroreductase family protein [uncultured Jatrophihabitans sp.]|uniref:nitroreductase family protein n=1 Tax=uncultured Jatrophihabitans sp. TaxID=1610747 RepID=UPI0035CAFFC7